VIAIDAATALAKIAEFEALVGIHADFRSPGNNVGAVMEWVIVVNRSRVSHERPTELDEVAAA